MIEEVCSNNTLKPTTPGRGRPRSVSKGNNEMDIEESPELFYEELLQEKIKFYFVKIFTNINGKGHIRLLDYVFMRVSLTS